MHDTVFWVLFWAIGGLFYGTLLFGGLWILDKLLVFVEPLKKSALRIGPLLVIVGLVSYAIVEGACIPPALMGLLILLGVFVVPLAIWLAWTAFFHLDEDWALAMRNLDQAVKDSRKFWGKWIPGLASEEGTKK